MTETTLKDQAARDAAASVADYEHGWSSDIETDFAPKGLSEDTVRFISAKKNEPEWMLDWRLNAYRHWLTMTPPDWAKLNLPPIDYQDAYYYAAPKAKPKLGSLDEVDPEILRVYEKLGIPIEEQKVLAGVEGARKVAVDAVFDSVSVATTFRAELESAGVIFRSISEAIREYPDQVKKWLGKVVPMHDNYFSALNCAVFSDGTFVYIPEGVRCPMELSTYFRINAENTGQFERTLIVADKGSSLPGHGYFAFVVRKDLADKIKEPADLRGRVLAVTGYNAGASSEVTINRLLAPAGVKESELRMTNMTFSDILAGLGTIQVG